MASEPSTVELGDYLGIIRRRFLVVGVAVAVCLALGTMYGLTRPDVYRSTAQIALPAAGQSQTAAQSTADVQTELAVIQSDLVATEAAKSIEGGGDPRDLLARLTVQAPPDARIIILEYTASSAEVAQAGAQAFAEAYLSLKEAEQTAAIETRAKRYDEPIAQLTAGIEEQEAILASAEESSREYRQAESEGDRLSEQLATLRGQQTEVRATAVDPGTLITPARLPRQPRSDGLGRTVAAAIGAGLALGLGAAFVLDRLDTRVRGAADLQKTLGVRTLGSIPVFPEGFRRPPGSLVMVQQPDGGAADAFRRLRTSVLLTMHETGARTLAITSATANEGKSTVAANLAVAAAQSNRRVLLVSADLHQPGIETLLEKPASPGLSDLLLHRTTLDEALRGVGELVVLTRGSAVEFKGARRGMADHTAEPSLLSLPHSLDGKDYSSATDFISSELTVDVINALMQGTASGRQASVPFDLVIFDTPPVMAAADVLVLAPRVDATLLVVSLAEARSPAVAEALSELSLAGANVVGAVVNNDAESTRRASGIASYAGRA